MKQRHFRCTPLSRYHKHLHRVLTDSFNMYTNIRECYRLEHLYKQEPLSFSFCSYVRLTGGVEEYWLIDQCACRERIWGMAVELHPFLTSSLKVISFTPQPLYSRDPPGNHRKRGRVGLRPGRDPLRENTKPLDPTQNRSTLTWTVNLLYQLSYLGSQINYS